MTAPTLALLCAASFFLSGLLTGVWKYWQMSSSADGLAHPYVDIAHRASLLYAFAATMLAYFTEVSQLPNTVELIATSLLVAYFALAILGYIGHAYRRDTDNQVRDIKTAGKVFLWSLVVAEIGGFLVIFYGLATALL